ncbi:MAG: epoxyqueuosine reductase QueH [Deltaproteobacteria bacterium]|nr:epoxyqueuosine reductase QueH [Deltaproteobacteria bacterium]
MKILLHICCAPCSIFPVEQLRDENFEVRGFFFRHNIHPYTECLKREESLKKHAARIGLKLIYQTGYDLEGFLRKAAFREQDRCRICYFERLNETAKLARHGKFDCFSSTLLYSKFQNHELIRQIGESIGKSIGIPFYYSDFRTGWKYGIEESKKLAMYRQQYCGCIYSEKQRFFHPPKNRPKDGNKQNTYDVL